MTISNDNESRCERVLRKIIAIVVVIAFLFPFITPTVFAAASVTMSGKDSVKGGETFTVTVTYGDNTVGRVDGQLQYDTSKLIYISGGSSQGNTGYIQLKSAGTGNAIVFNIKFQAVTAGSTSLKVTTNEVYSLDETVMSNPAVATKTINITGDADDSQLVTETTEPETNDKDQQGVDEKPDDSNKANSDKTLLVLLIATVIIAIVVAVIAIVLFKKGKNSRGRERGKKGKDGANTEKGESGDSKNDSEWMGDSQVLNDDKTGGSTQFLNDDKTSSDNKQSGNEELHSWDDWGNRNNKK